jgi:hypothetical protein
LLISLNPDAEIEFQAICGEYDLKIEPFGVIKEAGVNLINVLQVI